MPDADQHDWRLVTPRNGDRGYQCARCRLTAVRLPVHISCWLCPPLPPYPTLRELLDEVRSRHRA